MKTYLVSYQSFGYDCWISVGNFRAKSAAGALQQFARDLRHFPSCAAIKAELKV